MTATGFPDLGIRCVAGTRTAATQLRDGELVTVDAAHRVALEGSVATAEPPSASAAATAAGAGGETAATRSV